jgi:hypothetical protein
MLVHIRRDPLRPVPVYMGVDNNGRSFLSSLSDRLNLIQAFDDKLMPGAKNRSMFGSFGTSSAALHR